MATKLEHYVRLSDQQRTAELVLVTLQNLIEQPSILDNHYFQIHIK